MHRVSERYPLRLMLMTNDPGIARLAEAAGVDRLFVDTEVRGKAERQAGRNTIISGHTLEDVRAVRAAAPATELMVRLNPPFDGTPGEVDDAIEAGADVLMLPMFNEAEQVAQFVRAVRGRTARTCLLLETATALARIDTILEVDGIDEVHVGLNDLHISFDLDFMFELLAGGSWSSRVTGCAPAADRFASASGVARGYRRRTRWLPRSCSRSMCGSGPR